MVIEFFTPYVDEFTQSIVTSPSLIALHYFKYIFKLL